ncbi:MAG: hypothetical protein D6795_08015, partial [Deltaproteobacteria bacterium]
MKTFPSILPLFLALVFSFSPAAWAQTSSQQVIDFLADTYAGVASAYSLPESCGIPSGWASCDTQPFDPVTYAFSRLLLAADAASLSEYAYRIVPAETPPLLGWMVDAGTSNLIGGDDQNPGIAGIYDLSGDFESGDLDMGPPACPDLPYWVSYRKVIDPENPDFYFIEQTWRVEKNPNPQPDPDPSAACWLEYTFRSGLRRTSESFLCGGQAGVQCQCHGPECKVVISRNLPGDGYVSYEPWSGRVDFHLPEAVSPRGDYCKTPSLLAGAAAECAFPFPSSDLSDLGRISGARFPEVPRGSMTLHASLALPQLSHPVLPEASTPEIGTGQVASSEEETAYLARLLSTRVDCTAGTSTLCQLVNGPSGVAQTPLLLDDALPLGGGILPAPVIHLKEVRIAGGKRAYFQVIEEGTPSEWKVYPLNGE